MTGILGGVGVQPRRRVRHGFMLTARTLACSLLMAALLIAGADRASAAPLWSSVPEPFPCPTQPSNACVAHTGFNPLISYWGQFTNALGNCTNYVAYRLQMNGAPRLAGSGNAITWKDRATAQFGGARVNTVPAVGAVAWWGTKAGADGHVAYVEKVEGGTIYVSESVWSVGSRRRVLTAGTAAYPDAFLHILDAPSGVPIGALDSASSPSAGRIHVRGWAFDPDSTPSSLSIHVYVGGPAGSPNAEFHDLGPANGSRPDVDSAYGGVGAFHGYDTTFDTAKRGGQSVYVYAINAPGTSGGNPLIGTGFASIANPDPYGWFDAAQSPGPARIYVRGWAYDPNSVTTPVAIHVYVGGPAGDPNAAGYNLGLANISRPDVGAAFPGIGNYHGFEFNFATSKVGALPIYAYAINVAGTPGNNVLLGSKTIIVAADTTAPTPAVTRPTNRWTLGAVSSAWTGADAGLGTKNFDVQRRAGTWNGAMGAAAPWLTATASTSGSFTGIPGSTYCIKARARDHAGNTSAFSTERCTAVPLTSDQATFNGLWSRATVSGAYAGFLRSSSSAGATLSRSGLVGKRVALIATKCPTCGSVKVYWNGVYRSTVNLYASTTMRRQTIELLAFASPATGTLKLTVATSGKPVIVEGIGVSKSGQ